MNKKLTLGSLFDGSGGFPLGGLICGIEPLWASEVEPFPIRVTTKRLPQVQHLGDINKINGANVPPVDIITGGFCCQDLSVAGKRAGLHGERSGLFFQVIRIIKEMLATTNNDYPKFAVLENVPGMYSSNKGLDFLEVLNELIKIKDETLSVHLPESGKWSTAGEIVGDGFSIGWRTLDAQFWGVAQRRRRCYIVIDFTGECAGEILFDESRLSGNPPPSSFSWERTAGSAEVGTSESVHVLNDQGGSCMSVSENVTGTLRAQEHGHPPITYELGVVSRLGRKGNENLSSTLRADMGDNQTAVVYENHPADSRVKLCENGVVQTLSERMGTGGGNVPLVMNERQYALTVGEDVSNTLTGTDFKGTQCIFEPKTMKIRSGCDGGGKGALVQDNKSATLSTNNDQTVFVPKAYGICSQASNSMKSSNPNSGIYEAQTSRTLDTSVPDPNKNAGGMAVVAVQGSMIGRKPENGPQGSGVGENISFSLTGADRHAICYQEKIGALCASDYKFPQQQQIEEGKAIVETFGNNGFGRWNSEPATLKANGGDYPGGENVVVEKTVASFYPQMKAESICYREDGEANTLVNGTNPGFQNGVVTSEENHYVVRRLTPTECALLQGFPPTWCTDLETIEPTEDDIAFWADVFETHRRIAGTSTKPKSRNQIVKWLKTPHSDSAEYKMWGNGICLWCAVFVLGGIVWVENSTPVLAETES